MYLLQHVDSDCCSSYDDLILGVFDSIQLAEEYRDKFFANHREELCLYLKNFDLVRQDLIEKYAANPILKERYPDGLVHHHNGTTTEVGPNFANQQINSDLRIENGNMVYLGGHFSVVNIPVEDVPTPLYKIVNHEYRLDSFEIVPIQYNPVL